MSDRGMMKWAPYKSLIEQESALSKAKKEKANDVYTVTEIIEVQITETFSLNVLSLCQYYVSRCC